MNIQLNLKLIEYRTILKKKEIYIFAYGLVFSISTLSVSISVF